MALIAGMAPGTCNFFFLSLKKEITKKQGWESNPVHQLYEQGVITTTLPASWVLELEIFEIIKCHPYYFIRANQVG